MKNNMKSHPIQTSRGTEAVPPNNSKRGCVIGSPRGRKGSGSQDGAYKHNGIVIGGSVTGPKPSVSAKSINRLPNKSTNVVG